jgi:hypothetical protein
MSVRARNDPGTAPAQSSVCQPGAPGWEEDIVFEIEETATIEQPIEVVWTS